MHAGPPFLNNASPGLIPLKIFKWRSSAGPNTAAVEMCNFLSQELFDGQGAFSCQQIIL
jgi:hypothetical protein